MLGYFAIYSRRWSDRFAANSRRQEARSIFGLLPHEIAELNDR